MITASRYEPAFTKVWKYPLPKPNDKDYLKIEMPRNAEILTCQVQGVTPCIWARVDPREDKVPRYFRVAGTDHEIEEAYLKYVGSYQLLGGKLIFHLFEAMDYVE